jgi:succinate dehydrogenase / fumarate reductase cytochrome b subunit
MSNNGLLKSSLAKKYLMALTGLFLCLFLVGHLLGNLQLFATGPEGAEKFNLYAKFMTTNPLIMVMSYLTYACILFHVIDGFVLTIQNRKARPVKYVVEKGSANSSWSSRNMAVLGTILLVFIVTHMQHFWFVMHFGGIEQVLIEGESVKDLHAVVMNFFNPAINSSAPIMVGLYVFAMAAMGYHLQHGFSSAFQSMGLNHAKYTPVINKLGTTFCVLVPLAFASIPVYLYYIQIAH